MRTSNLTRNSSSQYYKCFASWLCVIYNLWLWVKLVEAFFSSTANFLIYLGSDSTKRKEKNNGDKTIMNEEDGNNHVDTNNLKIHIPLTKVRTENPIPTTTFSETPPIIPSRNSNCHLYPDLKT